jgi:beta-lactam-binding protein with PASTA domain/predicted Ser/Thr protein kinase
VAVTDPLIDALFDGRYRILRKLGAGGMANVYLAEDQELGRRVAIKILNDRHANDEQFVERFRREAKNAAALSHPNIVSIYDRGEAEGTYYIAMEYLDGRSLKELIVSRGPAPVKVALEYARQILSALRFAHRHGIVHRDIKPHNVLVDGEGRVKVTDFGIARAGASQMTEAGSIVGTAQYLSPEQARGGAVDQRSDLYSLGIVLYELLTGEPPFQGETPVEIAMKHLSHAPEPPSALRPDLPRELDWIVMRALAKDPEDRYQSAEEMDADLERVSRGAPVAAATEESATQVMRVPAAAAAVPAAGAATMIAPPRPALPAAPAAEYYEYDEGPGRDRALWPWLLAILLIAAAGIGGWYVYHQLSAPPAKVVVGTYAGETLRQADAQIISLGLSPDVHKQANETTKKGIVFRQDPSPGSRVAKKSSVSLYVSTGKPKVKLPDVRHKTQADAVKQLDGLGLKAKVNDVPGGTKGEVVAEVPSPGTVVIKGSVVRLNVQTGPPIETVPNVVGEPLPQATSDLRALHLKVNVTSFKQDKAPPNQVIQQTPAPGKKLPQGSTVNVTVSNGPPQVTVPNVVGESQDQATSDLKNAGFKVTTQPMDTTDPTQDGQVISQSPAGNGKAPQGSAVAITVGHFVAGTTTATTTTTTIP